MKITEPDGLWVGAKPETTHAGNAVGLAVNEKAVQMGVIPPHDDLEDVMQVGQALVRTHIPQFTERKNRIVNTQGQADEEPAGEAVVAPKPGFANVNQCGYARDQCLQSIEKSSAS